MAAETDAANLRQKRSRHKPPPGPNVAGMVRDIYSNQVPPLRFAASLVSHLALASIGGLAFSALASLPTFAAPGITLKDSFMADGSNGANPIAALTAAGNGLYYGTTYNGGANGNGAIFEFNDATGLITLKGSFVASSNGASPNGKLTPVGNGIYYGTTEYGGNNSTGVIFSFDSVTGSITLQDSFIGSSNGAYPSGGLTAASNGIYYGTTSQGGANNLGAIFEFDSTTGSITLKNSVTGYSGWSPIALTDGGNGLYYGTSYSGGASSIGNVFKFDSTTSSITPQDSFNGSNGTNPRAALTAAGNGIYYGTAFTGGANNTGAIFEFNSATGSITLKASFAADGSNGARPAAALTAAGYGLFYGTTESGGANNKGAIFEFNSVTGSITLQDSFAADGSNGSNPRAALTAAGNGIYYGTAATGGANNKGAIFAFDSGVRDPISAPVPGPLPVVGIGAAFGWSRKLRRRLRLQQPGARSLA